MHVGLVIYGRLETISGGYLYDRKLVDYLERQGDRVEVISLRWRDYARHLVDNLSPDLYRCLRDARVDVLLQDELNHPSLVWINRRLRRGGRYPIVSLVHHPRSCEPHPRGLKWIYRQVERAYLSTADRLVLNSETTRHAAADLLGRALPPAVVAYPGGDRFRRGLTEEQIVARACLPGPLRIAFVGNLIPRKGLHVLLDALARLPRDAWELTVVGNPAADPRYTRRIMNHPLRSASRAGGPSRGRGVSFLGSISDDELGRVLRSHHVLAVPSTYEGFGIVYVEGMSQGLPALATTAGGASEIITEGENGFLVEPDDPVALAARLTLLYRDRDRLAQMSRAAVARSAALPRWEESMQRIRAALEAWSR